MKQSHLSSCTGWPRVTMAVALLAASGTLHAACTVATQSVVFDTYDFLSDQATTGVGQVSVSCDAAATYQIGLGPSPARSEAGQRVMTSGEHTLAYNLYTTSNHSVVWGDGADSSTQVSGQSDGTGTTTDTPIYGLAPARQNPYVGSYSDTISVTLTF